MAATIRIRFRLGESDVEQPQISARSSLMIGVALATAPAACTDFESGGALRGITHCARWKGQFNAHSLYNQYNQSAFRGKARFLLARSDRAR
ncbi:MAG TPA: hypothetical protein ACHBZA_11110 [Arsenophonus apicola]